MQIVGRPSKEISFMARLAVVGIELQLARPYVWTDAGNGVNVDIFALPFSVFVGDDTSALHVGVRLFGFGFDVGLWLFRGKPCSFLRRMR